MKHSLLYFFRYSPSLPLVQNNFLTRSSPTHSAHCLCHPAVGRSREWFILFHSWRLLGSSWRLSYRKTSVGHLGTQVLRQSDFVLIWDQIMTSHGDHRGKNLCFSEFTTESDKQELGKPLSSHVNVTFHTAVLHDPIRGSILFIKCLFGWVFSPDTTSTSTSIVFFIQQRFNLIERQENWAICIQCGNKGILKDLKITFQIPNKKFQPW